MKSVMRMRHYCDHCKKSTGTKPAMVKHEKGCTANPGRVCSMCALAGEVQLPMPDLLALAHKGFKALQEACHDCPACLLAVERQIYAGSDRDDYLSWDHPYNSERGNWDFKTAVAAFWKSYNEENREERYAYDGCF